MSNLKKRTLSIITAFSLCLTMFPIGGWGPVLAAEPDSINGSCSHHPIHTSDCGYVEAVPELLCTHEHNEECYQILQAAKPEDDSEEAETEETGADENAEGVEADSDNEATEEPEQVLDCRHEHDDACGYAAAVEGTPCGFICRICPVQALIDALPAEDAVTVENAADVEAQLTAVDEAKAALTDEETEQLDKTRYEQAIQGLMRCLEDTESSLPQTESSAPQTETETDGQKTEEVHEETLTLDLSGILSEMADTPMLLEAAGTYYGDQLEGTTKSFYEQYKEFFTELYNNGGGNGFTCIHALPDTVKDISMAAIYALTRDHPELLHWINGQIHFRWLDMGGAGYKYVYIYFDAIPEYVVGQGSYRGPDFTYPILDLNTPEKGGEAYRQKALQAAAAIVAYANETFDTDYEKIQYFHEEICRLTDYDFDTFYNSKYQTQAHSMYRVFNGEKVVCAGYAKAFKYLCDLSDIRCLLVDGHGTNSAGQSGEHMWNYVELFGNWYLVDATWNDSGNTRNYFMIGSSSGYYKGRYNPDLTTGHPALCPEDYHFVQPNKAHVTVTDSDADRLILGLSWEDASKEVVSALDVSDIIITPEVTIKSVDVAANGTSVTVAFDGHPESGDYQVRIKNAEKFVYAMDETDFYVPPTSTIVHVSVKEAKLGSYDVVLLLEPESDLFGMPDLTSGTITTNRVRINRRTQSSDGRELTLSLSEAIRTDLDYIFYFEDSETFQYDPGSLKIHFQGLPQAGRPDIEFDSVYEMIDGSRWNVAAKVTITRASYDKISDEYISIIYTINDGPEQVYTGPFIWEPEGTPGDTKAVNVKAYVRSNYPDQYRSSVTTKKSTFARVKPEPTSTKVDVSVQSSVPDQAVLTLAPQTVSLGIPIISQSDLTIEPEIPVLKISQSGEMVTIFFAETAVPGDYTLCIKDTEKYKYQPVIFHIDPIESEGSKPDVPDEGQTGESGKPAGGEDSSGNGSTAGDGNASGSGSTMESSGSSGNGSTVGDGSASESGSITEGSGSSDNGSTAGDGNVSGNGSTTGSSGSSGSGSSSGRGSSSGGNHASDETGSSNTSILPPASGNTADMISTGTGGTSNNSSSSSLRSVDTIRSLPASKSSASLKPDQEGNVMVGEEFLSSLLAQSVQTSGGLEVVVPVKPIGQKVPDVTISASAMELLSRQNVQRLELQVDGVLSAEFNQDTLKALVKTAKGADIRLLAEETNSVTLAQSVRAALGTYAAYDLALVSLTDGIETPLKLPEGCSVTVHIPCTLKGNADTELLRAFYVDQNGKMRWIEASGYDPNRKEVTFQITQLGIYGIGYQSAVPISEGLIREPLSESLAKPSEIRKGIQKRYPSSRLVNVQSRQGQYRKPSRQSTLSSPQGGNRHAMK